MNTAELLERTVKSALPVADAAPLPAEPTANQPVAADAAAVSAPTAAPDALPNMAPTSASPAAPVPDDAADRAELARRLETALADQLLPTMRRLAARRLAEGELRTAIRTEAEKRLHPPGGVLPEAERRAAIEQAVRDLCGYGALESLWRDESVSELSVCGTKAFVERAGRRVRTDAPVSNEGETRRLAERLAARCGETLDDGRPMTARLPDGNRLTVVPWPLSTNGTLISLHRKPPRAPLTAELVQAGAATTEMLDFLAWCVKARVNVVVAGPSGLGAHAMLAYLAAQIPREDRTACLSDPGELHLAHPDWISFEVRPAAAGRPANYAELLAAALDLHVDYLISTGAGSDWASLLDAMAEGRRGVLAAVPAASPRGVISRLESHWLQARPNQTIDLARQQAAAALEVLVQTEPTSAGGWRIATICEVSESEGVLSTQDLFHFEKVADAGRFTCCGNRPRCLPNLMRAGARWSNEFFDRRTLSAGRVRI